MFKEEKMKRRKERSTFEEVLKDEKKENIPV